MEKFSRIMCLVLFLLGYDMCAEYKIPDYEKYTNQIISEFEGEVAKKYQIVPSGSGGRMPYDVEKVEVSFIAYRKATLEEARSLLIKLTEELLVKINNSEKIRPYLHQFPFTVANTGISFSFSQKNGDYYPDNSIAFVYQIRNTIFYDAADASPQGFKEITQEAYPEAMKKVMGDAYVPSYVQLEKAKIEKNADKEKANGS